jgi:hypothetical protein
MRAILIDSVSVCLSGFRRCVRRLFSTERRATLGGDGYAKLGYSLLSAYGYTRYRPRKARLTLTRVITDTRSIGNPHDPESSLTHLSVP